MNHRIRLVLFKHGIDLLLVAEVAVLGRQEHPLLAVALAETRVGRLVFDHVADGRADEAGAWDRWAGRGEVAIAGRGRGRSGRRGENRAEMSGGQDERGGREGRKTASESISSGR